MRPSKQVDIRHALGWPGQSLRASGEPPPTAPGHEDFAPATQRTGADNDGRTVTKPEPTRFDWRAWLALAWALWFGWQYAQMVVEQRGGKARGLVTGTATAAAPNGPARPVSR